MLFEAGGPGISARQASWRSGPGLLTAKSQDTAGIVPEASHSDSGGNLSGFPGPPDLRQPGDGAQSPFSPWPRCCPRSDLPPPRRVHFPFFYLAQTCSVKSVSFPTFNKHKTALLFMPLVLMNSLNLEPLQKRSPIPVTVPEG